MKKQIALSITLLFTIISIGTSQTVPQLFNYQAVIRDANNEPVTDEEVNISIQILDVVDNIVFEEEHTNQLVENGLVNLQIGSVETIQFSEVNWEEGPYYLKANYFINNQWTDFDEKQLVSVPYALYAQNSGNSYWEKQDANVYYTQGNVGIGVSDPSNPLEVVGSIRVTGSNTNGKFHMVANNADQHNWIRSDDETNTPMWYIMMGQRNHNDNFNIDRSGNGKPDLVVNSEGYVGLNTNYPTHPLEIDGMSHYKIGLHASSNTQQNMIRSFDQAGNQMWVVSMGDRTSSNSFVIDRPGDGACKDFYIDNNSHTHVRVLEIKGGCDIKEDLNSIEKLEPGDVVVIDENNPGQVRRTREEYDKKVAGIISGANGINPGISLSQDDVLEGEYPLTMLGRVYVKVAGKVEVGDMLTTSSKAGYAMAVNDYSKSNGTVIGKAMTANEIGDGMVLVLVNLQ